MVNNQDNAEHHHSALGREQPPEDRVEHVPDEVNSTTVKYEEDKTHVGYDARKVRKTAILYMSFIALGLSAGIAGPTLVDMQLLLGIDTKSISVLFTAHGLGYLAGSIVCGLVYNKATPELQFTVACFTMALATAAAPWSRTLGGFVITMVVQAIAMGYIDAAGQALGLQIWAGLKWVDSHVQALHAMWCVGSTISPFIVQFFLIPKLPDVLEVNNTVVNISFTYDSGITFTPRTALNLTPGPRYMNDSIYSTGYDLSRFQDTRNKKGVFTRVEYGYLLIGSIISISGIFYLLDLCFDKTPHRRSSRGKETERAKDEKCFRRSMLVLLYFWFLCYVGYENSIMQLIATFVIRGMKLEKSKGPLVTSTLHGAVGLGRWFSIPLAAFLSPTAMICLTSCLTTIGFLLLSFLVNHHEAVVWISAALIGLGMSAAFASAVVWASRYIKVDGVAASICLIGSSTGMMTVPYLIGYLFQTYGHMSLPYACLTLCLIEDILFLFMNIYTRCREKSQEKNVDMSCQQEIPLKESI